MQAKPGGSGISYRPEQIGWNYVQTSVREPAVGYTPDQVDMELCTGQSSGTGFTHRPDQMGWGYEQDRPGGCGSKCRPGESSYAWARPGELKLGVDQTG